MSKSKFIIDKLAKLFEQGLVSYKDLSSEIVNILRSKRDEIIFKMQITSKEELEILVKRIEKLEQKIEKLETLPKKIPIGAEAEIKSRNMNLFILCFLA